MTSVIDNHNGEYIVVKSGFSKDSQNLYILTKAAYIYLEQKDGVVKHPEIVSDTDIPHSLAKINYEDGLFIHKKTETGFHPTEELEQLFNDYMQEV